MIDTGRLKSVLTVTLLIAVCLFLINGALTVSTAAWPNWLPRQFFGIDFIVDNRHRVRAAAAMQEAEPASADTPLVVVVGLSSASEGVSLDALRERLAAETRVLGLAGGGRNISDAARYAEPLLQSRLDPSLVILAINAFHLLDPPPVSEVFVDNLTSAETMDALRGYWLVDRRRDIKHAVDARIDTLRSDTQSLLRADMPVREDPWREIQRMHIPQSTLETQWRRNLAGYRQRGYYDAENFLRSRRQPAAFRQLVEAIRERGAEVMVVLMPLHSRLREQLPAAARELLTSELVASMGDDALPIDLTDAIADDGFSDISHMNQRGRDAFGPLFADVIAERFQSP